MKQKFTFLTKLMLLLCALIAGGGTMWATEGDILNETFTSGLPSGWSSDPKGGGSTTGASTADSNGHTDSKCWKLGTNSNPYGSITTSALSISGDATLTFWTKAKNTKAPVLLVTGTNCTLTGDYEATSANNNTYKQFTVNITNVTGSVVLTFKHNSPSGGSYIYLDDIVITSVAAPACATPTFSPAAGTYSSAQTVTISTETDGATIYYTTDGTTPSSSNGTAYSSAITVSSTQTIKAIAVKAGNSDSEVATATYTITSGEATTTTIDASGITNTNKFVSTAAGSLSATVKDNSDDEIDGATVTWSGDNDEVATINASTGAVTLVGAGTVTFTATYAGVTDTYQSSYDTYEMTVTNEDPDIVTIWSENFSSYSAEDVPDGGTYSYACTNGGGTSQIYAQNIAGGSSPELLVGKNNGTFSATIPLLHPTYGYSGNLTLTFKSNTTINVKTTTDGITVDGEASEGVGVTFLTKDTHTVTFKGVTTSTEDLTIVFTATTSSNVRLDDIVLKGKQAELSVVATPSISPASGAVASGTEVTMTCLTDGATIYYTTNGDTPTSGSTPYDPEDKPTITSACTIKAIGIKDGLTNSEVASASYTIAEPCATPTFSVAEGEVTKGTTVTISCATDGATIYYTTNGSTPTTSSSVYSSAITINTNQTIKAIAAKDGYANSAVASATYTVIDYATLPFAWDDKSTPTGVTNSGVGTYSGSPYLKFDNTGDYIVLKTNTTHGVLKLKYDIQGNSFSGGTFKVQYSADGSSYTDLESYTSLGAKTTESFTNIPATTRYIKWIYTTKDDGNVALGNIKLYDCKSVTLNSSGYATFASTSPLDFTDSEDDGYSAWKITGVSGSAITFGQITGTVAAGTGVLLKGTASSSINIPVVATGSDISATNKLEGITSATKVDANKYYGLSSNKFVKVNAGTVPAGKALLPASEVSSARELKFVFEDETTGIKSIDNGQLIMDNGAVYDLQGRKVTKPVKGGLYIVNGKKVIM